MDTEGFSVVVTVHAQTVCPACGGEPYVHVCSAHAEMSYVLDFSALFQANSDFRTLGESRAGMHAYQFWLWGMPPVVTIDGSAERDSREP